jgi:hypothetical protein
MDIHGLYVLLTRTTRGRDGMILLLSEGANTLQSLRYLLELKRPKDFIIFLGGYDLNGFCQEEQAREACRTLAAQ